MLRHRASLQPELFPRAGHGETAAVRADGVRPAGWNRRASGGRAAHEAHGRPLVRRQNVLVGPGVGRGGNELPIAAMAAAMGGNIRVGLEDSLWAGPGRMAASNAEQVQLARKIIEGLGLEVATSDEAREILDLKGGDKLQV